MRLKVFPRINKVYYMPISYPTIKYDQQFTVSLKIEGQKQVIQ